MIRELRDVDVPAVVRLFNEIFPLALNTEAGYRHRLASEPARAQRRTWVAEEGDLVGWAAAALVTHSERDDVGWIAAGVLRAQRGRGLGSALFDLAERHLRGLGARRLLAGSTEEPEAGRFLSARGFVHSSSTRLSRLDPHAVDLSALRDLAAEKEREGFTLAPFTSFRDRPEAIHAVDEATSRDIPHEEPVMRVPFDEWLQGSWRHPLLAHDGSYAVVLDRRPVALASLRVDLDSGRALNDYTGTLREFRGRGLARLAKLASLAWAAEKRITEVVTENDTTNAPMLAVNTRLGYRPFAAELFWTRDE